jgi:hypothetical protein
MTSPDPHAIDLVTNSICQFKYYSSSQNYAVHANQVTVWDLLFLCDVRLGRYTQWARPRTVSLVLWVHDAVTFMCLLYHG